MMLAIWARRQRVITLEYSSKIYANTFMTNESVGKPLVKCKETQKKAWKKKRWILENIINRIEL